MIWLDDRALRWCYLLELRLSKERKLPISRPICNPKTWSKICRCTFRSIPDSTRELRLGAKRRTKAGAPFFEGEALSLEGWGKDHSVNYVHDTIAAQDIGLNDLSTGYGDAI